MDPQPPIPANPPPPQQPEPEPQPQPPPTTNVSAEPTPTQMVDVSDPTPQQAPTPHHPPYAEMITTAIAALKERNGSSKKAISKYVERVYSNLPSTHLALLSHHLKLLKSSGQIVMVKHSYKLPSPRSAPPPLLTTSDVDISGAAAAAADSFPAQPKRKPGRPPKPKPDSLPTLQVQNYNPVPVTVPGVCSYTPQNFVPNVTVGPPVDGLVGPDAAPQIQSQNFAVGPVPVAPKRKPGRPPNPKPDVMSAVQDLAVPPAALQYVVDPNVAQNAGVPSPAPVPVQGNGAVVGSEAMFVSLGLADGPAPAAGQVLPKRRGRPPKGLSAGPRKPWPNPVDQSGPKRKKGRPRKNVVGYTGIATVRSGSGRPRGRPRKDASAVVNGLVSGQPKRRGRKPKNAAATAAAVTASVGAPYVPPAAGVFVPQVEPSAVAPGAVQVPYAQTSVNVPGNAAHAPFLVPVAVNGVASLTPRKRRGRPPKANGGGPKKPRRVTGKPLGRPRKNASAPGIMQQFDAVNLKRKLEYLQTKIKQTVNVLKPCIEGGNSASAMEALQQLEELATTVVANDVPANAQVQQSVPQV